MSLVTNSLKISCTTCRRREAFYYRQSSGEKLCSVCLEESLETHVKHSFSRRVKLSKNPIITVYIPADRILEGFLLAYMLAKIEKNFGGVVSIMTSKEVLNIIKERRLDEYLEKFKNVRYSVLEKVVEDIECYTIKSLEKSLKNLGENAELINDTQAVLLPYTLTDLNEAFLEHVILGVGDLKILKMEEYLINRIPLILPYARVDRTDVIVLSHTLKFIELLNAESTPSETTCRTNKIIKDLVLQITLKHPELTHTMLKSIGYFSL
ncbi:MAG: hypothetical protein QN229_00275 [Desulfurococcaceae archaeon TW002]